MNEKLVRNTSDKESREWWKAIRSASKTAPKLTDKPSSQRPHEESSASLKPSTPRPQKK